MRSFLTFGLLAAALALFAPPTASATAAAQPSAAPSLVSLVERDRYFSPNDDGVGDRARFEFRLRERAYVSVLVRDTQRHVVTRVRIGVLPAGHHVWRWDGRSNRGVVVPDGRYGVAVHARGDGQAARVVVSTNALTEPDAGRLVLSRPVVYPAATAVTDSLGVVYVRAKYSEEERLYWRSYFDPPLALRTRLVITAPNGKRVLDSTRKTYRPSFTWFARTESGQPMPEGTYRLRVTVRDAAGNVRTIRRAVEVSWAQLAERVWTSTIPAESAELGPWPVYDPSCLGCGEVCGPVPSDRFPGGLSFQQPCSFGYAAVRYFGATPPVVPAPVDAFRVTAVGGPTTPGDTDVARFGALVMGPGDATVTTPWENVDLGDYPYLPDADQPVTWAVSTSDQNDYDIASFTIEYRYYVPVIS
jgi:flagellar hook assembly protein FlgD